MLLDSPQSNFRLNDAAEEMQSSGLALDVDAAGAADVSLPKQALNVHAGLFFGCNILRLVKHPDAVSGPRQPLAKVFLVHVNFTDKQPSDI